MVVLAPCVHMRVSNDTGCLNNNETGFLLKSPGHKLEIENVDTEDNIVYYLFLIFLSMWFTIKHGILGFNIKDQR